MYLINKIEGSLKISWNDLVYSFLKFNNHINFYFFMINRLFNFEE